MLNLDRFRPVWAEINLDHLIHNIKEVRRIVRPETKICVVIKADAYGHGAREIAEVLLDHGADRLAVATLSEAIQLRRVYPDVQIMVLGYTPESCAEDVIIHNIIQTVYSLEQAKQFSKIAQELNNHVVFHIKIDTGMSRLGFQATDETIMKIVEISKLPNTTIEGIFTHFAVADELDKNFTKKQYEKFINLCNKLEDQNIKIPIKHVSNSAAIIDLPEMNLDMVRAGIMLYGLYPSHEVHKSAVNLKQVLSLKAKISHVKDVSEKIGVSYGLKFVTEKPSQLATLPLGYADGFTRMLTGKAEVLVKGSKVPVVGRICMDQCMIDTSGLNVRRGDEVILLGTDGYNSISIDDVAQKLETINYEIICMIGKRVPRVYIKDNEILRIKDHLLEI